MKRNPVRYIWKIRYTTTLYNRTPTLVQKRYQQSNAQILKQWKVVHTRI